MSSINTKTSGSATVPKLAGGLGGQAAILTPIQSLRRMASTYLLWEDAAYLDGKAISQEIAKLVPLCDADDVAKLAIEIRENQQLRHAPLFLLRELFRIPNSATRKKAGQALTQVIRRADEVTEFLAIYWKDGKVPLANQVKLALGDAISKFDAYQLAKYKDEDKPIALRDVLHLVHAKPKDTPRKTKWTKVDRKQYTDKKVTPPLESTKEELYWQLSNKTLPTPETREVLLSAAKTQAEKKDAYETLLSENKLGVTALLKNLKGMTALGVNKALIEKALSLARPDRILPLQFFSAYQHAPQFAGGIDVLMQKCLSKYSVLSGHTTIFVDTSGSMAATLSKAGSFNRQDCAAALAVMAKQMCETSTIYLTSGNDGHGIHRTEEVPSNLRGFDLWNYIQKRGPQLGGGGIFTRQALEYVKAEYNKEQKLTDRIIVLSDSQDCDHKNRKPAPFAKYNYVVDVSCERYGINYKGVWTQEISGWSQTFLEYIAQCEIGYQSKLF